MMPKTRESEIKIPAHDGGSFMAYVAKPDRLPAPGLIVIQEIFGVNQVMRDICEKYARKGYIAACPDLFWRQEPGIQLTDQTQADWNRALELFNGFDTDAGVKDLDATLKAVRNMDGCTGKAGNIGFCLGGQLSYLMAARTDVDCAVSYYGVGIENLLDEADKIKNPLILHIAEEDKFVSPDAQEKIKDRLLGVNNVTIYSYPGVNHAFARPGGEHYNEDAAQLAGERTAAFLEDCLKSAEEGDALQITNV